MKFKFISIIAMSFALISCSCLLKNMDEDDYYEKIDLKTGKTSFSILFSNNINGETHSCGCGKYPLGGIPQLAGLKDSLDKESISFYLDTGDTFFPSSTLPPVFHKSLTYTANNILIAMNGLGLQLFLPGEQDFAAGEEFLIQLAKKAKFDFIISNYKDNSIKHKKWKVINIGEKKVYFIGVVEPSLLPSKIRKKFLPVNLAIEQTLEIIKTKGFSPNNPKTLLIVMTHQGLQADKKLANEFPLIDWIIGSHDQSFLQQELTIGKSKIAQAQSLNHYLGEIRLGLGKDETKYKYELHAVANGMENNIKPNPYIEFINKHKEELARIQSEEEKAMTKEN